VLRSLWVENRLTILHSRTAAGKTSLLNAGVLPLLTDQVNTKVMPPTTIRATSPHISRHSLHPPPPDLSSDPESAVHYSGSPSSITEFIRARLDEALASAPAPKVLAAIDQFERLYSFSTDQRMRFLRDLTRTLRQHSQLNLLILVNDDWITNLKQQHSLTSFEPRYVRLSDLTPLAAIEALTRPLRTLGYDIHHVAAQELMTRLGALSASIGGEPILPAQTALIRPLYLQIVGEEVFPRLSPPPSAIRKDMLDDYSTFDQAFTNFYDSVVDEVHRFTGVPEDRLRAWIESEFVTQSGALRDVRRGAYLTAGMPNWICDLLVDSHILDIVQRAQRTSYRLESDSLAKVVLDVNRLWRDALSGDFEYRDRDAAANRFEDTAEAALTEGDISTAQRFAALAAARYDQVGDWRRLAHALVLKACIAQIKGQLDAAERSLQEALSLVTVLQDRNLTAKVLSALADVSASGRNFTRAAEFQQLAVDYLPTDVDALVGLAFAQWYGGSPADADATFSQALSWDPNAARAWVGRGQVRAEMEEYDIALSDIERALECGLSREDEIDALSARALALAGLGRSAEGADELAAARGRDPQRPRTLLRSARLAVMHGESQTAARELERGLEGSPPLSPREQADARKLLTTLGASSAQ
jgi:tetratricopeptide (TPR) repeat protein